MSEALPVQDPETVIRQLRPHHKTLEWHNGGDNRDVVVVDGEEAFRFPKDDSVVEVGRYEFEVLKLIQGRLSVQVPRPIELAPDGSYNVLSFLKGHVLSKHEVSRLPFEHRRDMGIAVAGVINQLNRVVTKEELAAIPTTRPLQRSRDDYYLQVYQTATRQQGQYAAMFRQYYERLQAMRPNGSAGNIIVFGDFSSPNLVLSDDYKLTGLIDWTELGLGDMHNELRPVFSVIGQEAFDDTVATIDPALGPVDKELVRTLAVVHELGVLVNGKQKGVLTPERAQLAMGSLRQWLPEIAIG